MHTEHVCLTVIQTLPSECRTLTSSFKLCLSASSSYTQYTRIAYMQFQYLKHTSYLWTTCRAQFSPPLWSAGGAGCQWQRSCEGRVGEAGVGRPTCPLSLPPSPSTQGPRGQSLWPLLNLTAPPCQMHVTVRTTTNDTSSFCTSHRIIHSLPCH